MTPLLSCEVLRGETLYKLVERLCLALALVSLNGIEIGQRGGVEDAFMGVYGSVRAHGECEGVRRPCVY